MSTDTARRHVLKWMFAGGTAYLFSGWGKRGACAEAKTDAADMRDEEEVTPVEDLMREHGVLRRVLLIYEEVDRRNRNRDPRMAALAEAAGLIKSFVEDYHEKLEESQVFPRFEKAGKLTDLTVVLRTQHDEGRRVTAQIRQIACGSRADYVSQTATLSNLIRRFIRMYRPHAAREDTVLFPGLSRLVGPAEYRKMGDQFEDRERELFGEHGFETVVGKVARIEKSLGIYDLAQFTPRAAP